MAQIRNFTSTNDSYFVLDGVSYPKVYEAMLDNGYTKDKIKLVGTNRDNSPLVFSTHYSNIRVDGASFASANAAISRLNQVVFSKGGGSGDGGTTGIQSIQEGANITVDNTDPQNPIISALGGGGSTDQDNIIKVISFDSNDIGANGEETPEELQDLIAVYINSLEITVGDKEIYFFDYQADEGEGSIIIERVENIEESLDGFLQEIALGGENIATGLAPGALTNTNIITGGASGNISQLNIPVEPGVKYVYEGVVAISTNQSVRSAVLGITAANVITELLDVKLNTDPTADDEELTEIDIPVDVVMVSLSFRGTSISPKFYKKGSDVPVNINVKTYVDESISQIDLKAIKNGDYELLLPRTHYKLLKLKEGDTSTVLNVALFGDSWTQSVPSSINYAKEISKLLRAEYGDGGAGFYDFSRSSTSDYMRCADSDDATDVRSGSITYKDQTADSLGINIAHPIFGTSAELTLSILKPHDTATIHFMGGTGQFSYKIGAASAVTVDTASYSGYSTINITLNNTIEDIILQRVTGSPIIFGIDLKKTYGVRVHKFGNRGLRAYNYLAIDRGNWKAALSKFDLDFISVLLGTNDKTDSVTPEGLIDALDTVMTDITNASPLVDRALICPSNNRTYNLEDFELAMKNMAIERDIPFYSTLPLFGSTSQILNLGSFYDVFHPTELGGKMIAEKLFNRFFKI